MENSLNKDKSSIKKWILTALFLPLIFFNTCCNALPFTILPKTGTQLPTTVNPGATTTAYYTVFNNTATQRNNNYIKFLPPNVSQVTSGGTYSDTCSATFNLAAKGNTGASCTLQLTISGAVNGNAANPSNHLFACFPGGKTCSGTEYPLNVTLNVTPMTPYVNWINHLSQYGYSSSQGNTYLMTNEECPLYISIFNSCFDQNPAAPYIIPQVPTEQSYVDPFYAEQLTTIGPNGLPTNIIYRLGDNDALVTIVSYPPKAAYLGYQSYVFTSESSNYPIKVPLQIVSPDPARYELFASIGNDINNVIVQNQNGVPWGGNVEVYITTSNQALANALIANATAQHINPNSIFIEPVGSNVRTGNGSSADDLVTLIRYAVPESDSDASSWISGLSSNVLVYKVSNPDIAVSRYGVNQYTARIGTTNEQALQSQLSDLAALLQTYLATAQGGTVAVNSTIPSSADNASFIPSFGFVGSVCLEKGTVCLGDNQDSSTYANLSLKMLGSSETAFIVGVNHNQLNNADYISNAISNAATSAGVASSSQTNPDSVGFNKGVLTGSAQAVLDQLSITIPPSLAPALPYLYVTFVARDCSNPTIAAASTYCINLMGDSLIPADGPILITERSYIRPGTTTGGNVNIMTYPLIVAATQDFN